MSDEQIIHQIAASINKKRLQKKIKSSDLAAKGGVNPQTYSNFINKGTDIRISTLIQILRGLGELELLEKLFEEKKVFYPSGRRARILKRVRSSKKLPSQSSEITHGTKTTAQHKQNSFAASIASTGDKEKLAKNKATQKLLDKLLKGDK